MASRVEQKQALREQRLQKEQQARAAERARSLRKRVYIALGAAAIILVAIFAISNAGGGSSSSKAGGAAGKYPYQVGTPGPGQAAPALSLASTDGGTFDLSGQRGKTVLLYFQEGLGCQPCWDQIKDLERQQAKIKALGIDTTVSITTNELGQLRQKAADEGIRTPVLSDPDLAASKAYNANQYGMMGDGSDGHSFVVVGPDGQIKWRADYGGAPKYTMYVPMENLLADMRKGLRSGA